MPQRKTKEPLLVKSDQLDANLTNDESMQMSMVQESDNESNLEQEQQDHLLNQSICMTPAMNKENKQNYASDQHPCICIEPLVQKNEKPGRSASVSFVHRKPKKRNIIYYLRSTTQEKSKRSVNFDNATTKASTKANL